MLWPDVVDPRAATLVSQFCKSRVVASLAQIQFPRSAGLVVPDHGQCLNTLFTCTEITDKSLNLGQGNAPPNLRERSFQDPDITFEYVVREFRYRRLLCQGTQDLLRAPQINTGHSSEHDLA